MADLDAYTESSRHLSPVKVVNKMKAETPGFHPLVTHGLERERSQCLLAKRVQTHILYQVPDLALVVLWQLVTHTFSGCLPCPYPSPLLVYPAPPE